MRTSGMCFKAIELSITLSSMKLAGQSFISLSHAHCVLLTIISLFALPPQQLEEHIIDDDNVVEANRKNDNFGDN